MQVINNVVQAVRNFADAVVTVVNQVVTQTVRAVTTWVDNVISEAAWNRRNNAPGNIAELHDRLRDWTSKSVNNIYIERVQDKRVGGTERIIVYIGGTTDEIWSDNQSLITNLPAYRGEVKQHQVNMINNAIGSKTGIEILIVGFSQGGLDAQNLANEEWRLNGNVKAIVTYGAPIIYNVSNNYQSVHLGAYKDPVTGLSKEGPLNHNIANAKTWVSTPSTLDKYAGQWWNPRREIDYHGDRATYTEVTNAFVRINDSRYAGIKATASQFRGKVTGIW